jgi:hypothetical protein
MGLLNTIPPTLSCLLTRGSTNGMKASYVNSLTGKYSCRPGTRGAIVLLMNGELHGPENSGESVATTSN